MFQRITFLFLAVALCTGLAFAQTGQPTVANHLELTNDHLEQGAGNGHFIAGTINNLNDKSCDVIVNVNVYGTSHTFLSNRTVRRNALQPSTSWDFHIGVGPQAESYEILSVRARWYRNDSGAY